MRERRIGAVGALDVARVVGIEHVETLPRLAQLFGFRRFDAELLALNDRAKSLKGRKVRQLGELVAATGTDVLDAETLAGGLLAMMESVDAARKESWRKRGQAFFQRRSRGTAAGAELGDARGAPDDGRPPSA